MRAIGIASSSGGTGSAPAVTITGSLAVGSTLTASISQGYGGTPTYQWVLGAIGASDLVGATNISGATSSTYTLAVGDFGRLVGCLVSGLTFQGGSVGVVAGVAPSVVSPPVVTSTPRVGQTIGDQTYTEGSYNGTPAPTTALDSWLLNGSVVPTGYTLAAGDLGKGLAVKVVAANSVAAIPFTSVAVAVQQLIADTRLMIGGNLPPVYTYGGLHPFNNALLYMAEWNQMSGSGAYTAQNGKLTATVQTDKFRAFLSNSGSGLPLGTYTVFNPDGCLISVAGFNDPGDANYTRATQFTFNYTGGLLALWCKGSFTANTGRAAVIPPYAADTVAQWQAGNIWRPEFLSYVQGLKLKTIRFMDALGPSYSNIEDSWADRTPGNCISAFNMNSYTGTGFGNTMSWEMVCDLCNRVGAEPLISMPVRVDDNYVQQFATLMHSQLNPGKSVWVEYGNEVWNFGAAYVEARTFVSRLKHTKYTATADFANQQFYKPGHGLTTGSLITAHASKAQRANKSNTRWPYSLGGTMPVVAVDANNFRTYVTNNLPVTLSRSGTTLTITWASPNGGSTDFYVELYNASDAAFNLRAAGVSVNGTVMTVQVPNSGPTTGTATARVQPNITNTMPDIYYSIDAEPGKSTDLDTNHGTRSLEIWNILQATAPGRTWKKVLGTWGSDPATTKRRLSPTGVAQAADYLAIADYWAGGGIHGFGLTIAGSTVTPLAYSRISGYDVYVAAFPQGTAINRTKVLTGAGALYSATRKTAAVASTYDSFTATTALTPGQTYEFGFVFVDVYGWQHLTTKTVLIADGTTYISPAKQTEALSNKINIFYSMEKIVRETNAEGMNIPLICYEGGSDYYGSHPAPILDWITNTWFDSPENGDVIKYNLKMCAALGIKAYNQYTIADNGVWGWGSTWTDTNDERYKAGASFAGRVDVAQLPPYGNLVLNPVESKPATFPSVLQALDATCTHTIVQGNDNGWFSVLPSGELVIQNDTGLNWGNVTLVKLGIMSERAGLATFRIIQFILSDSWYDANSWFAWSPLTDTNTTQVDPAAGRVLTRVYGSTYPTRRSDGLWETFGTQFAVTGAAPPTDTATATKGFGFIFVADKAASTQTSQTVQIGGTNFMRLAIGPTVAQVRCYFGSGKDSGNRNMTAPSAGLHVYWIFYDPVAKAIRFGIDGTEDTVNTYSIDLTNSTISQHVYFNNPIGEAKAALGAVQAFTRENLSLANMMTMVNKMKAHHGIP